MKTRGEGIGPQSLQNFNQANPADEAGDPRLVAVVRWLEDQRRFQATQGTELATARACFHAVDADIRSYAQHGEVSKARALSEGARFRETRGRLLWAIKSLSRAS